MRTIAGMDVSLNISHRWEVKPNDIHHCSNFLTIGHHIKHKVRDPVDRFISRFNFNRSEKRINSKLLSDTRIHDIIPETWWTRTSGCRERNFMWISKRRGEDPIWPSASLASSLSVFIRSAVAIFSSHVCCQHFITAKVLTMWFQGTVPQYQRLYRADSQVRFINMFLSHLLFQDHLVLWNLGGLQNVGPPWFCATRNR